MKIGDMVVHKEHCFIGKVISLTEGGRCLVRINAGSTYEGNANEFSPINS